jgi:hypothetical protein
MKKLIPFHLVVAVALAAFSYNTSFASNSGTDNAAQSPYSDGWQNGDNGAATGNAFQAWNLSTQGTSGNAGFFIGDSTTLNAGNTGADINTSVKSFGLYGHGYDGNGNAEADAVRNFNGGALLATQTFSLDIAVNYQNGYKGVDLRDGGGGTIFNLNVSGNYLINGSSLGAAYNSNTAFHLAFTQDTLTGGTYTVTRSGGLSGTYTGTYSGDAAGFKLYEGGTDNPGNPQDNLYANNFEITPVPEASTWATGLLTVIGALAGFRRRRS